MTRRNVLRLGMNRAIAFTAAWGSIPAPVRAANTDPVRCSARRRRDGAAAIPIVDRKLIVILFGGGVRSSESLDDPDLRFVPRLGRELAPNGVLFTNVRVNGPVVHPNCTASILTGHPEYDDFDWTRPVSHPTLFEIFRTRRRAPDTSAWFFAYASILAKAGESRAAGYGSRCAANVVEPPTIPRDAAAEMDRRMLAAARDGTRQAEIDAAMWCASIARERSRIERSGLRTPAAQEFLDRYYTGWKASRRTTSHDAFLANAAIECMRRFAPAVLVAAFGEIDCAHFGSWSRYTEAIRRTDDLTWRIWSETQRLDSYRNRTLFIVLPDHGRELERPGGSGFVHHGDFTTRKGEDEGCRRVWLLALGPGV